LEAAITRSTSAQSRVIRRQNPPPERTNQQLELYSGYIALSFDTLSQPIAVASCALGLRQSIPSNM
jgi:hypothetical protein